MTENICGATNRHGEPCGLPAGWGTGHVGEGRCKLHGGETPRGEDSPHFEHGLFSDYLGEEDRRAADALAEYDDADKLEELINWRLARLRRYLREMSQEDRMSFWDAFRDVVHAAEPVDDDDIRALAQMLDRNNRAVQQEIDLVRKLIKDHNKIAGDGGDLGGLRDLFGGGDT